MTAESDIAAYLASGGFGTVATDIFINMLPATPDNCISVSGYAGSPPERTHDTSGNDRPSVQIRVRNTSADTSRSTIESIYNHLDGIKNTTIGSTFYLSVAALHSGPNQMGEDGNGRTEYTWNFQVLRRR